MRRFVCLTNIPTPYRLFQFRRMHANLEQRGWEFEVWFMARSEARRSWEFDPSEFDFPHQFLRGSHFRIGSDSFHFNPEVLNCLGRACPDVLLVAGGWALPTVWLASLARVRRKLFWSESHLGSIRRNGFAVRLARRFLLSRFRKFAVPGRLAKEYVEAHTTASTVRFLPNLVDPAIFRDEIPRLRKRSRFGSRRVLLIVARLTPEKGLIPFLDNLRLVSAEARSRLSVVIAGDGPLLSELTNRMASHDFDIRLVGKRTQIEMVKLYADANGFCLPSLSDPNPLAAIEALWAGLPLLLSSRVGNHVECLENSRNGFLFDPLKPEMVAEAVSRWLELSENEIRQFGESSLEIAQSGFDPETVIRRFLDELIHEKPSLTLAQTKAMTAGR